MCLPFIYSVKLSNNIHFGRSLLISRLQSLSLTQWELKPRNIANVWFLPLAYAYNGINSYGVAYHVCDKGFFLWKQRAIRITTFHVRIDSIRTKTEIFRKQTKKYRCNANKSKSLGLCLNILRKEFLYFRVYCPGHFHYLHFDRYTNGSFFYLFFVVYHS